MLARKLLVGALLASFAPLALSQDAAGDIAPRPEAGVLRFKYAQFDPADAVPTVPAFLRAAPSANLWVVQFVGRPQQSWRDQLTALGAEFHNYVPDNGYVVRMSPGIALAARELDPVRWVGAYEPAFRLEAELLTAMIEGQPLPVQNYNLVVVDKRRDKPALEASIESLGGKVVDRHEDGILLTATLDPAQLAAAAHLDQVLWIDRWMAPGEDMDNGRNQGGGNYVEAQGGYTGSGIRGHVYEGVESTHPDFRYAMTNVRSSGSAARHGHCTAGIVFGRGSSTPGARGMAPDARGYYTTYTSPSTGWSRSQIIAEVVNTHGCMFTTASWGNGLTTQYTSFSASADDIVFDHRIPWTQSQSNTHNRYSRPEAWAKNVFSVGAVQHYDNANPGDDSWQGGGASIGPAADGRFKPDFCFYYDRILTSDLTGSAGYSSGSFNPDFGGTSGATPMVAGHNALAIQMYTDFIFGNTPRVPGGSRFQNRPYAQTLKALMIACARQYLFTSSSTDNLREHQGWGYPNLRTMYDNRNEMFLVPEDDVLRQGNVARHQITVGSGASELKICMTFLDPAGNPAVTNAAVNDLSLRVTSPGGTVYWGNVGLDNGNYSTAGGSENHVDSVECVFVNNPAVGTWTVEVLATQINQDAHVATGATDATYALCVTGGTEYSGAACADYSAGHDPSVGPSNVIPFGPGASGRLASVFAQNNQGSAGGAVYFDVTVTNEVALHQIAVNSRGQAGTAIGLDVYLTDPGVSYSGNETTASAWNLVSSGIGTLAGVDEASYVTLREPLALPVGNFGVALVAKGFQHAYTDGNGTNQNSSNANLALSLGSATNVPFSGNVFTPRVANVELTYRRWTTSSLSTGFAQNNRGSVGGAVYFDLTTTRSLRLTRFDVNANAPVGSRIGLDVFMTPRGVSYATNETNPGAWTLVTSGAGIAMGTDNPSAIELQHRIPLDTGSYGVALVARDFGHYYTNGALSPSDPNLSLSLGTSSNRPFQSPLFNPRSANIAVRYDTGATFANVRYQQIVRRADISHRGSITGLSFASEGTGEYHFDTLLVRMSQVPAGRTLSTNFASNLPTARTVLNTRNVHWTVERDQWIEIGLQQAFPYNGAGDLVIEVQVTGNDGQTHRSGFHRDGNSPRVYSYDWRVVPGTAHLQDSLGQRIRLDFGCANTSIYGRGCGDLELRPAGLPVLGGSYSLNTFMALPNSAVFWNIGITNASPFPISLEFVPLPGCTAYTDALITVAAAANTSGYAQTVVPVPNDPRLAGLAMFGQSLQLNPSAPGGATVSNYARLLHGVRP